MTRRDVERFLYAVSGGETAIRTKTKRGLARVTGGRGTASRTVGLLGAIFTYALRQGLRPDNPVHGIVRFADGRRERRLSGAEYAALGMALNKAAGTIWPDAVAAARFLALTGWRRGEVLNLRWPDIDFDHRCVILEDSKTGRSMRPLSKRARAVLLDQPRGPGPVFRATRGDGSMIAPGLRNFREICRMLAYFHDRSMKMADASVSPGTHAGNPPEIRVTAQERVKLWAAFALRLASDVCFIADARLACQLMPARLC